MENKSDQPLVVSSSSHYNEIGTLLKPPMHVTNTIIRFDHLWSVVPLPRISKEVAIFMGNFSCFLAIDSGAIPASILNQPAALPVVWLRCSECRIGFANWSVLSSDHLPWPRNILICCKNCSRRENDSPSFDVRAPRLQLVRTSSPVSFN